MNVLEKIIEEIEEIYIDDVGFGVDCNLQGKSDLACDNCYECMKDVCKNIIRKYMDSVTDTNVGDNDGWISVEERLPDRGIYVMCCFDDGTVDVLWQNWKDDKSLLFYADIDNEIRKVIAWQKLPEPYKPKKDISETGHIMSGFVKVK